MLGSFKIFNTKNGEKMKLFLDTANIAHIKQWVDTGLIDGVTTNPTILSSEKGDPQHIIAEICSLMSGRHVSVEVTVLEPEAVYKQAHELAKISDNVVVKIPCDKQYCQVISRLVSDGVPVNVTLIFSLFQGLAMCKLGVDYISPYVGRIDDMDGAGASLIEDLAHMIDTYGYQTELLAASVRTVVQLHDVISSGADCVTVPVELLEKAIEHPLTKIGMEMFMADWQKLGIKIFP